MLTAGRSVTVEVPATTANLGPGFDCFGLALDWRERVNLAVIEQGYQIEVSGEGAAELPRDESHLIIRSALVGLADLGVEDTGALARLSQHDPARSRPRIFIGRNRGWPGWCRWTGPGTGETGLASGACQCHRGSSRQCGRSDLRRFRLGVRGPNRGQGCAGPR